ncbi:hypothetical protein [Kocuria varians]|uniref:hypothetical protein n=1 Tax=Kocuria varians TaxID=1272 RepID=UPI0008397DA8|nr:hypothetical protein [Kocuria varians]
MSHKRKTPLQLTDGWEVPVEGLPSESKKAMEAALGPDPDYEARWDLIEHKETGQRAIIRVSEPLTSNATITAVTVLPAPGEQGVTSRAMRSIPIAALQTWHREQNVHKSAILRTLFTLQPPGGQGGVPEPSPSAPLQRTERDDIFYALVAHQYREINRTHERATAELARVNEISESTAQRWLWEARKRNFLAPGRPGRRTKSSKNG